MSLKNTKSEPAQTAGNSQCVQCLHESHSGPCSECLCTYFPEIHRAQTAGNAPERELRSRISLKYGSGKGVLLSAPEVKTLYKLLGASSQEAATPRDWRIGESGVIPVRVVNFDSAGRVMVLPEKVGLAHNDDYIHVKREHLERVDAEPAPSPATKEAPRTMSPEGHPITKRSPMFEEWKKEKP